MMKQSYSILLVFFLLVLSFTVTSQTYFPPKDTKQPWETISPTQLGMCQEQIDSLYNYLEDQESKGFILLKDGKIVLEKYFGTFTKDSLWYWASAGKTLTSFLIGKAQEENYLNIQDLSSKYLGKGWSSLTTEQEDKIKIFHHLTMTTGLDDNLPENHCTLDSCLIYKVDAGKRWAYHNAPYTLLETILTKAVNTKFKSYTDAKIATKIGMTGWWIKSNYDNVYYSNLRSMARYELLIQNNAIWEKDTLMKDTSYLNQMVKTSQSINPSYGYLWWLNGKSAYMFPGSQIVVPGSYAPDAPSDVISALGKNGQIISISKSKGLVFVRMGKQKNSGEVTTQFANEIWKRVNALSCKTNSLEKSPEISYYIYPNPTKDKIFIQTEQTNFSINLIDLTGKIVLTIENQPVIDLSNIDNGIYILDIENDGMKRNFRVVKE